MNLIVPTHACTLPDAGTLGRWWTCPVCGAAWVRVKRMVGRALTDGWTRGPARLESRNLRTAYEAETIAAALPWWRLAARRRLRREARFARALAKAGPR